jgi:hypothetical protein
MTTKLVEDTEKSKKNLKRKIEELGEDGVPQVKDP